MDRGSLLTECADVVILADRSPHRDTDWAKLAKYLASRIVRVDTMSLDHAEDLLSRCNATVYDLVVTGVGGFRCFTDANRMAVVMYLASHGYYKPFETNDASIATSARAGLIPPTITTTMCAKIRGAIYTHMRSGQCAVTHLRDGQVVVRSNPVGLMCTIINVYRTVDMPYDPNEHWGPTHCFDSIDDAVNHVVGRLECLQV